MPERSQRKPEAATFNQSLQGSVNSIIGGRRVAAPLAAAAVHTGDASR